MCCNAKGNTIINKKKVREIFLLLFLLASVPSLLGPPAWLQPGSLLEDGLCKADADASHILALSRGWKIPGPACRACQALAVCGWAFQGDAASWKPLSITLAAADAITAGGLGCRAVCSQSSWWLCSHLVFVSGFLSSQGFSFGVFFFPRVFLAFRSLLQLLKISFPEQVCCVPRGWQG